MKDYEKGVKLMESVTFGTELIGLSFTFLVRFSTVSWTYNGQEKLLVQYFLSIFTYFLYKYEKVKQENVNIYIILFLLKNY